MSPKTQDMVNPTPAGACLTWIFDHCMRYPGSYEIPLRTMYDINCNSVKTANRGPETAFSGRSSGRSSARNSTNSASTKSPRSSAGEDTIDAAADFRSHMTYQISRLPSQPCSLPPTFLTSFLRRCFTLELESVDFPQALTALDYLNDLECRWKKEICSAMERLKVTREDAANPGKSELATEFPGVMLWVESMGQKARRLEAFYTQIYIGLRRWTLINDMLLEPRTKANNIVMLNVLFPPMSSASVTPTPQLTHQILQSQRDGFWQYIDVVDTHGGDRLDPVISQGAPEGHATSWPLVHEALDKYLVLVNEVIDECILINEPSVLVNKRVSIHRTLRGKKADSGISFIPPQMQISETIPEEIEEKPLPFFPVLKKSHSPLERLANELQRLRKKSKGMKIVRSSTSMSSRPASQQSYAESSFFEIDEQKRRRLIGEATTRKNVQSS
ncbi:hypothetical protein N7495_008489 [Penicillium taxi]|uniref:uncharacterized protein n=1 Tax=Penicillium taxi TaxID=168475 RepID=UPI002545AF9A|nr:uncharacterized protein N7495_008489 [Penicillium taxi]KAJ5888448.1 hypothetical protein N7495_008489 [Penicillium taxi]